MKADVGDRLDGLGDRLDALDGKMSKMSEKFKQFVDNCELPQQLAGGGGRLSREDRLASQALKDNVKQ